MVDGFKRYLLGIIALFTLLLPFFFYSSGLRARQNLTFVEKVVTAVSSPVDDLFSFFKVQVGNSLDEYILLLNAKREARELRQENAQLAVKLQMSRELELENQRLRELVHFSDRLGETFLAARVLARDPSYLYDSLRINLGSEDGVRTGMAVVSAAGSVGMVMKVSPHVAHVLLITDPNSSLDVIVSRNRKRGVLQGTSQSFMFLKHVGKGSKVQVGDQILTSGLTGAFPRGLSVGRVVNIQLESDNVSQRIEVEPSVDFADLLEVLVLKRLSPEIDVISQLGGEQWMEKILHTGTGQGDQ